MITQLSLSQWLYPGRLCEEPCVPGTRYRDRGCMKETIQMCFELDGGATTEVDYCATDRCPAYTSWTPWETCSETCDTGIQTRTRTCTVGTQDVCDVLDVGDNEQFQFCNTHACPRTFINRITFLFAENFIM